MRARVALLVAGLILAGLVACWVGLHWLRPAPPVPVPNLAGAEDAVRAVVEEAQAGVQRAPGEAGAWGWYGKVLLANGFDAEAFAALRQAAELDPEEPRWPYLQATRLLLRDRAAGLDLLRRAVELADRRDPDNTACRLLLIEAVFEQGDYSEASELARAVLAREPANPRAHFHLGACLLQQDDLTGSLEHLSHAAESPFARKRACVGLAAVSLRMGNKPAAEQFARRVHELPADLPPADPYVNEIQALAAGRQAKHREVERLEGEQRLDEGARILHDLATTFPDTRSQTALGTALIKLGDPVAAEPILREAVRQTPDCPAAHYALAVSLQYQGDALARRGLASAAQERYREAKHCTAAALAVKPDHAMAHHFHGLACRALKQPAEALTSFRRAVRCRPEVSALHFHLGEALAEAGEVAEARKELQIAADLAPADPLPREALERLAKR
jgi:tetratricopeptide (TPR) repeat protein